MQTVTSKDGTKIAYDKLGSGPALIFVAGATCHRKFEPIAQAAEALAKHFTVYNYDRRGRGDSTDTLPFAVEREIDDIEALIDDAGGSAYVYGHSSGAALAFEAALKLGNKVKKLAMYEPPYCADEKAQVEADDFDKQLEDMLSAGKRSEAMEFFMSSFYPPEMIEGMKQSPDWAKLEAMAHTLLYDSAAANKLVPVDAAKNIAIPTTIVFGKASFEFMGDVAERLSKAIPGAKLKTLQDQDHAVDPDVMATELKEFFEG